MRHLILAAAALALASTALPAVAQQVVPVSFAKGKSAATLTGSIKGDQDRTYTVDARAGQTMTVTLKSTKGSAEMNIFAPGKDEAISLGALDPYKITTVLPVNGRYRVQVFQMRASARRGEVANYTLTISIGGAAASTDAKVPGTGYNATAQIRCVAEPNKPMSSCKAGVKRGGNGSGTVHVTTPDGGSRVITFAGGKAVRSDSQAGMDVQRRGDTSVVRIGTVEVYEIPDAFIFGG